MPTTARVGKAASLRARAATTNCSTSGIAREHAQALAMLPTDIPVAPAPTGGDDSASYPRPSATTSTSTLDELERPGESRSRGGSTVRHLSCENCRVRKMKCSRQNPCLSCRMRGDRCVWIGQAPNGSADEDELEQSTNEVNRLKKLVDLLLARLEEQDEAEQQLEFYQHAQQQRQPMASFPPPPAHAPRRSSSEYSTGGIGPSSAPSPRWGYGGARSPQVGWSGDIPVSPMQGVQHQSPQLGGRRPSNSFSHYGGGRLESPADGPGQRRPSFGGGGGGGEHGRGAQGGAMLPPGARIVYGAPAGESQRSG
ncbi:hypothetical protein JCM9279_005717 [Rhodotorula babjevae]